MSPAILDSPPRKGEAGTRSKQARPLGTTNSNGSLTELTATVKARLLEGHLLRLIDFKPEQREEVMGIVANLRDKIAISVAWRTVRESSLSETRLRAKTYRIAGAFLRENSHG